MRLGWLVSPVLHGAAVAATMIAWATAPPPPIKPPSAVVPIDIVDVSDVSNVKPIAADAQPVETLAPETVEGAPQELAEAAPAPAFKPTPETTTPKPQKKTEQFSLDDVDRLLDRAKPAGARQAQQATGQKPQPGERPRAGVGAGDGLTVTEEDAIRAQMRECWRMPIDMATPEKLIVKVRVAFDANGAVIGAPEVTSPMKYRAADPATRAAAEAAIRAVRLCNPLRVNPNRRAGGEVTLNFDPREMIAP